MAQYLTGECGYVLVKVIEIIPEEIQDGTLENPHTTIMPEPIKEEKTKTKKTKKTKKK